ncbi:hypothetical protein MERGE_003000 [Pneumocystis wakefieldiae]|uniref:Histone acetyltransferase type B catalytic subunit n=1 Tax=Pneumocystis wakefieldiae TaxID=38082 RepID=A0A899GAT4_9ASCO|nr:hypothetical protein MERGE_003000 [Pneumocystis wakefieldiae]
MEKTKNSKSKDTKISINNHSLKKNHKKRTSSSHDSKINKFKRKNIYLLKKDNPNLAPPMDLSLYNLKYSWLYGKKRIQRRRLILFEVLQLQQRQRRILRSYKKSRNGEIANINETKMPIIFHPIYTYSIFEEERITGYKDLNINLKFCCCDLQVYLKVQYTDKVENEKYISCKNIEETLKKYLPETVITDETIFYSYLRNNTSFVPPGNKISSYMFNNSVFEVFMGSIVDPEIEKIVNNMQIFSLFLIEGASFIDIEDSKWLIFLLYEKQSRNYQDHYCFIGYSTVYLYYWYSREFHDNSRARIAQFVILPPFQRNGHGDSKIQEITVEDPSDEFQDMRDKQDIIRLKISGIFNEKEFKPPIPYLWILDAQKKSKISLNQFFRCIEIALLERLNIRDEKAYKEYRLQIKQRIYKKNFGNFNQYNKDEILKKLEETYKSIERDYLRIIKSMKTHKCREQDSSDRTKRKEVYT